MDIKVLLDKIFVFVVLMVIGYICSKIKIIDRNYVKTTNKLIINVFLVATILNSAMDASFSLSGAELFRVMIVLTAAIVLCYVLGFVASLIVQRDKERQTVFEVFVSTPNTMFFALPILSELFGAKAVFYCSLSCLPYNAILYTYGVHRLKSGTENSRIRIKDIFNVLVIATFAALIIFVLKIRIPKAVAEFTRTTSGVTMPMSMLVIGASLGNVSFFDAFKEWRLYAGSLVRLVICPLLVWVICGFMTKDPILLATSVIITAAPGATLSSILALQYNRDNTYASEGILLSTALSVITMPALIYLLL